MDGILRKQWKKLRFHDPKKTLLRLRGLENLIADGESSSEVRAKHANRLKRLKEERQGALLAYGLQETILKEQVYYARHEALDYDMVMLWKHRDTIYFTPVQLKEVVPASINPNTGLNREMAKLKKYGTSNDLVVAVHFNRRSKVNFRKIRVPKLGVSELWIFGALSPDESVWFLYGDMLKSPKYYKFQYPK